MTDYHKTITVNEPVEIVYGALTEHIADWWTTDVSGTSTHIGDVFKIAFGETRKTMEVTEASPNERIVWKCVKAYIDVPSLKNKAEWEGTRMIWTLTATHFGTNLNFLHEGLNPGVECYGVCEEGWDFFLASLKAFLATGTGSPYMKTTAQTAGLKN